MRGTKARKNVGGVKKGTGVRSTKARKNVGGVKKRDRLKSNWGRGFFEKNPSPIGN